MSKTVKYIVIETGSDYDCGAPWTSIVGDRTFPDKKSAYDALVNDMCKEIGISPESLKTDGFEGTYDGVDYFIPSDVNDNVHKCSDGFIRTECDGEIHWNILELND